MRVWSQRVRRGDTVLDRGEEREVKAVRIEDRAGGREVVLVFKAGGLLRLAGTDSVEVVPDGGTARRRDTR
ncbi:hypothetical protein J7W19_16460 [Streptomyces mobaraensis NBRC 13819 = DSM 40847]|nr:hypothetical protein [Streptomyces mobaraensis]QTT74772.1 hypothetical protein J7W19_16460 [Streptomyces mobaraensis NBRC 13819 = DSM 40847]